MILGVLNQHLDGKQWIMGDQYTIADSAIFPWVRNLIGFYEAGSARLLLASVVASITTASTSGMNDTHKTIAQS